ncbi:hypothetical protein [Chelatococcus asaccharovorans]|uniref:Uncharacterized protein n=1 Tax=Chelatococcus asaccharovorans TaxID=28210 RepID=A0A2V3UBS3_9HYPH|nr:hypothetical protein [Chelatococcus asaccharovorans]MBS7703327.1 hypothetical protein [Chelatococcus asaccharovorans]PXW61661.1 hypothetical protein C7450_103178 [Chelatococcus asaccharovorans]
MSIEHMNQKLRVTGVIDVVVTETVSDGDGGWVRSIRIFGPAGTSAPAVLEVVLGSAEKDSINIKTPELEF